jgi:peptidoglycan/xylan/chitin deacetylase (PgdA/CDA1 family)
MRSLRGRVRDLAYRHAGGTAVVLIYHRVAALECDPQLLAVRPEHFDAQMQLLAKDYRVIGLPELIEGCRRNSIPDGAVVVTFDDGYADNLLAAEPILTRHHVPATVFVSSGFVGGTQEFWWDEVDRLILETKASPGQFTLEAGGARFSASLKAADDDSLPMTNAATDVRASVYADLCDFIRPLSPTSRASALEQLRAALGTSQLVRESHRPLTAEELQELDRSAFVDVGAHTVNHPRLSSIPVDEQREEISADKTSLVRMLGHDVSTFSYPFGGLEDYTDESVQLVREAGFAGACSNHPGVVKPWTDPYRIPRNLVRDWSAEEFSARLKGWFDDPR